MVHAEMITSVEMGKGEETLYFRTITAQLHIFLTILSACAYMIYGEQGPA